MSSGISRMQFLRGDFSGRVPVLRPPWALAEEAFTRACERCNGCIEVCPTGLVNKGRGGFPVVEFSAGECLFCGDCVDACEAGALKKIEGEPPWAVRAVIDPEVCIAWQGVECRSCFDPCEPRAIRMPPRAGGVSVPEIDSEICSGCGACFPICPVQAVCMQVAAEE